jgi:opacity protein-like surface antigen
MKLGCILCAAFLLLGPAALGQVVMGQQEYQRADVFAGYSYFNADLNNLASRQGLNGWETALSVNANRWIAAEGDVSGYYENNVLGSGVNANDYGYLAGPRFNVRPAFFHILFGVDHLSGNYAGSSASQNSFAMALGGGVQWRVARHWAVRASADYVLTHHNILGGPGADQNNFRVGVGIVYTFGEVNRESASVRLPQPAGSEAPQPSPVTRATLPASQSQARENSQSPAMIPGGAAASSARDSAAAPAAEPPSTKTPSLPVPTTPSTVAPAPLSVAPIPPASASSFKGAIVEFWSRPAGADIELDGTRVGTTPVRILVPAGQHTVVIRKQDFQTWQQTFQVTSRDVKVAAYMEQIRYRVTFDH